MAGRYEPEGPEAEFEPGSLGRVLRNRLGIKSGREIERMESEALLSATEQMNDETHIDQCFTLNYLRRMHRVWFGEIYPLGIPRSGGVFLCDCRNHTKATKPTFLYTVFFT